MYYIGLDPGKNTGLAVWDTASKRLIRVETVPIHEALARVYRYGTAIDTRDRIKVFFEDARKRKWLPKDASSSEYRGHLMGAGSVKRDSVIWQDALTDWGIPFEMVPPHAGATKWTAETFAAVTGWKGRTSNHARDAALLVYGRK